MTDLIERVIWAAMTGLAFALGVMLVMAIAGR
jgi:hypothetical protein